MKLFQSKEWKEVLKKAGHHPVEIDGMVAFEYTISTPFGKKKILFARGTPPKNSLKEFLHKNKEFFYGKITPKITSFSDNLFKELGFKRFNDHTIMIDLNKTEEELWKGLEKKSARWGVKTAEKHSLVFEEAKEKDLGKVFQLYKKTAKEGGLTPEPITFFKAAYSILTPKNLAKFFIVKKANKLIAAGLLLIDPDCTMVDLTGSSSEGYKLQAMPFLYWNFIKYSKSLGKRYLDLAGYDLDAKSGEKTYQINRFKKRFGGEVWPQPIYSKNLKYPLIRNLMKKFRFLKTAYKRVS